MSSSTIGLEGWIDDQEFDLVYFSCKLLNADTPTLNQSRLQRYAKKHEFYHTHYCTFCVLILIWTDFEKELCCTILVIKYYISAN